MGGGTTGGTELLSDETAEEVKKLSEAARSELEEKKKLAEKEHAEKEKSMAEEIERLRAELKEAAPPSPVKQPLSEADAEAVAKIEEQAAKEDEEAYCTFEVLDKHQLWIYPRALCCPSIRTLRGTTRRCSCRSPSPSPRRVRACT